jgi:hypothetical protein
MKSAYRDVGTGRSWESISRGELGRFPDPPKNLGHDSPLILAIQSNRFALSDLRL